MARWLGLLILLTTAAPGETVRGVVVQRDGRPAAQATIRATLSEGGSYRGADRRSTMTAAADDDGRFAFEAPWPAGWWRRLWLMASAPPDGTGFWEFRGSADRLPERIVVTLEPLANYCGVVLGSAGRPQPGAVVEIMGLDQGWAYDRWPEGTGTAWAWGQESLIRCLADAAGRFRFEGLPLGFVVRVRASHPEAGAGGEGRWLDGAPNVEHRLRLINAPGITGRVIDGAGRSVAGLEVRTHVREGPTVATSADGRFCLTNLRSRDVPVSFGVDSRGRTIPPRIVTQTGPDPMRLGDLTVEPGARLSGVLIDGGTRRPLPQARVMLRAVLGRMRHEDPILAQPTTDAEGRFEAVLPRGPYVLQIGLPGYRPVVTSGELGEARSEPLRIVLRPDPRQTVYRILNAVVVDTAGQFLPGAVVALGEQWLTADGEGRIHADSRDGIPLDAFRVPKVFAPGHEPLVGYGESDSHDRLVRLVLRPLPSRAVDGRVVDEAGRPLDHGLVRMTEERGDEEWADEFRRLDWVARLGPDGRFHYPRAKARQPLHFRIDAPDYRLLAPAVLPAGDGGSLSIVVRRLTGRLRVLVTDASGRPAPGALVYVHGYCPEDPVRTDAAGRCLLTGLPTGRVTLEAMWGRRDLGRLAATVPEDGAPTVELTVSPFDARHTRDPGPVEFEHARALLRQAWELGLGDPPSLAQAARPGGPFLDASGVMAVAVAVDPELAWQLLSTIAEPARHDRYTGLLFESLAHRDPAAGWSQRERLASIADPVTRARASARLGLALCTSDPQAASALSAAIAPVALPLEERPEAWLSAADRAVLAWRLGRPEAEARVAELLAAEDGGLARREAERRLAREPELAERLLRHWLPSHVQFPEQPSRADYAARPADCLRVLCELRPADPRAAAMVFDRWLGHDGPFPPPGTYDHDVISQEERFLNDLVADLARDDPDLAERWARSAGRAELRGLLLSTVAARCPDPARALSLLREARTLGCPPARLSRAALDLAPDRAMAWAQQALRDESRYRYAFDLAWYAPNLIRERFEPEPWAIDPSEPYYGELIREALLLVTIDPDRAVEAVTAAGDSMASRVVLCAAARWLTLSRCERRDLGRYGLGDSIGYVQARKGDPDSLW